MVSSDGKMGLRQSVVMKGSCGVSLSSDGGKARAAAVQTFSLDREHVSACVAVYVNMSGAYVSMDSCKPILFPHIMNCRE